MVYLSYDFGEIFFQKEQKVPQIRQISLRVVNCDRERVILP